MEDMEEEEESRHRQFRAIRESILEEEEEEEESMPDNVSESDNHTISFRNGVLIGSQVKPSSTGDNRSTSKQSTKSGVNLDIRTARSRLENLLTE